MRPAGHITTPRRAAAFLGDNSIFVSRMRSGDNIAFRDWLNIMLGALGGFLLVYVSSHSVMVSLLCGIPSGVAGITMVLIGIKKLSPLSCRGNIDNIRGVRHIILVGIAGLIATNCVTYLLFPSETTLLACVFFDLFIIVNFIRESP